MISGNVPGHMEGNAMPWMVVEDKENNSYCVHKKNEDGTAGEKMKCYGSQSEADDYVKALYANTSDASVSDLFFTTLSDLEHVSTIDGLPVTGKHPLMDMHGKEVVITSDELPVYIQNTMRVLESTKDSAGNIVGLPIDMNNHDHKGGAGWLVGLELDTARNIIKFAINWTEAGIELVKKNIRRFFSASFDPNQKVILGGSMTNTPATRNSNYEYMLSPVELSMTLKELDMEKTLEERLAELEEKLTAQAAPLAPAPVADPPAPTGEPVELTDDDNIRLAERAESIVRVRFAEEKRKMEVAEFAASIVGDMKKSAVGFPIKPGKVTSVLLSLPDKQAKEVMSLLTIFRDGAIDFAEHGITGEGFIQRPKLPTPYRDSMLVWLESGKDVKSFFKNVAPELGKSDEYNLAEFAKETE